MDITYSDTLESVGHRSDYEIKGHYALETQVWAVEFLCGYFGRKPSRCRGSTVYRYNNSCQCIVLYFSTHVFACKNIVLYSWTNIICYITNTLKGGSPCDSTLAVVLLSFRHIRITIMAHYQSIMAPFSVQRYWTDARYWNYHTHSTCLRYIWVSHR